MGIDKGFDYEPGANADTSLRQMVQDKLITYPPAIAKAMSAELNRTIYVRADVPGWVGEVLADKSIKNPLLLGFVENAEAVSKLAGADVQGYMVTLPSGIVRHVDTSHAFDGKGQRPAQPADYVWIETALNAADTLRPGELHNGHPTVVATKTFDGEVFRAVFEVLPGKRNRALALLSLVIKTAL